MSDYHSERTARRMADPEFRAAYEGTDVDLEPSQKAPKPRWCPLCDLTIIERYAYCCEECRDALQSEDR